MGRDPSIIPLEAATGFEEVQRVIRDKNPRCQLTCTRHIKSHILWRRGVRLNSTFAFHRLQDAPNLAQPGRL
jgi:hypothetical protein